MAALSRAGTPGPSDCSKSPTAEADGNAGHQSCEEERSSAGQIQQVLAKNKKLSWLEGWKARLGRCSKQQTRLTRSFKPELKGRGDSPSSPKR